MVKVGHWSCINSFLCENRLSGYILHSVSLTHSFIAVDFIKKGLRVQPSDASGLSTTVPVMHIYSGIDYHSVGFPSII